MSTDRDDEQPISRGKRLAFAAAGWSFLGLGIAGAALPVLPTTPFLLLSLWAFSRSSQRMHDWLWHHKTFGPRLQMWRRHRVIPLRVKLVAWTTMAATLAYTIFVARAPWHVIVALVVLMAIGVVYVATKPSRPPGDPGYPKRTE